MLDLNDIAVFVHVVRAGSFAGAGRRRHVSLAVTALIEFFGERLRHNPFVALQVDQATLPRE